MAWTMTRWQALICVLSLGLAGRAHAGPVELFDGVHLDATKPGRVVATYRSGRGGLFLGDDAGTHFGLLCSAAIDPLLNSEHVQAVSSAGSIYIGAFYGLWRAATGASARST
jgi:hypothetical protein